MSKNRQISMLRRQLGFPSAVESAFSFLAAEDFIVISAEPTIVKFRNEDLTAVVYHGRSSYEIGFEIGSGLELFPLAALIWSEAPAKASEYRNPTATTQSAVLVAVNRVAELVRRYGQRALNGDVDFFAELRRQRQCLSETYALDVSASQLRPKANAAFREKRYQVATRLFEKMSERLTPSEEKKLAIARRKALPGAQPDDS